MSSQAAWNAYALSIGGGWALCANCAPGVQGKKLFRQYNFNRTLMGLAIVDSPIDPTEEAGFSVTTVRWTDTDSPTVGIETSEPSRDCYLCAQLGLGLRNPFTLVTAAQMNIDLTPGDNVYAWVASIMPQILPTLPGTGQATYLRTCLWTPSGLPQFSQLTDWSWFNDQI
jgi:hypothetical protein